MTAQQLLEAAQAKLASMLVSHQEQINALVIRKAKAEADAAEWEARRAKLVFEVSFAEARKLGYYPTEGKPS